MDLCYTDPGDSALRKGGMVVQTELGESKTSISPIGGPKGVASFSTIQVPGLEHIYEARTQCKVRLDWRTPRLLPSSPERLARPRPPASHLLCAAGTAQAQVRRRALGGG